MGINRDWQVNRQLPADTFELAFPDGIQVNDHRARQGAAEKKDSANLDSPQAVLDAFHSRSHEPSVSASPFDDSESGLDQKRRVGVISPCTPT